MDIDKDFIKGLRGSNEDPEQVNSSDEVSTSDPLIEETNVVAQTAEEALTAMASSSITQSNESGESSTTPPAIDEECQQASESLQESQKSNEGYSLLLAKTSEISEGLINLLSEISGIKADLSKFDGYEKAVDTLKRSLAAHQHNEDSIHKELEGYKRNQYYNYIRPFLEFLINLLTDMINSKKQYEDDHDDFVSQHGQEVYDEIVELHDFYIQQIESQLQIQGVEVINYEIDTPFIPIEQIISKPIVTENAELVGMVGRVDSACFKFEDKVLKKAKVHVYKAKPADNK